MARFAILCEIAGVSFTGCRVNVVNSEDVLDAFSGSADWGNDNTPHIQVFGAGPNGKFLVLEFVSQEINSHLLPLLDAIETAENANETFTIQVQDGMYDIDVEATKDYTKKWLTHGKHSEGWYEGITMSFLIKAAN